MDKKGKNQSNQNTNKEKVCKLCKSNGESVKIYTSHCLKNEQGHVTCPILAKYVCPKCQQTGINAHTIRYCPLDKKEDFEYKQVRNSVGKLCTLKY